MDLLKAFNCILNDLLRAKMEMYGFSKDFFTFLLFISLLEASKTICNINKVHSIQILLSHVPQGSIVGPQPFNRFRNDLFHITKYTELLNFADENTIVIFSYKLLLDNHEIDLVNFGLLINISFIFTK